MKAEFYNLSNNRVLKYIIICGATLALVNLLCGCSSTGYQSSGAILQGVGNQVPTWINSYQIQQLQIQSFR